MRYKTLALAAALCLAPGWTLAQEVVPPTAAAGRSLTLQEALALAQAGNPALRLRQAQLAAAEGQATDAAALLASNPQVWTERTRRRVSAPPGTPRQSEWAAGIEQSLELAGQRGHRREAAQEALAAVRLEIDDASRQLRAEVSQRFYRVLALQRRVEVEAQALRLFEDTAHAIERRRASGEDTRLDANVAVVEAERARNALAGIQEQLLQARADLAAGLQLDAGELPRAAGELQLTPLAYTRDELLQAALSQPRLQALQAREQSAQSRLRLERAARYPDVTVGVNVGREGPLDARERLTTVTLSVPLPLFKHNAAGIGVASTELAQAQVERRAAERDAPAQVQALWSRLQSLQVRVERLQRLVLPTLADNERLALRSREVGQIGLLELLVTSRQSLDARRDLIDALLDYHATRAELEAAAGWTGQP